MEKQVVKTFGEALSVLMQAAEQGRKAGIFDWGDLDLIGQSLKLINDMNKQESENSETEPEKETNDVVLEPINQD